MLDEQPAKHVLYKSRSALGFISKKADYETDDLEPIICCKNGYLLSTEAQSIWT